MSHAFWHADADALCPTCNFPAWSHNPAQAVMRTWTIKPADSLDAAWADELRDAVIEWHEASEAYLALLAKGRPVPPAEPDFEPWHRWKAAERRLADLAAKLRERAG